MPVELSLPRQVLALASLLVFASAAQAGTTISPVVSGGGGGAGAGGGYTLGVTAGQPATGPGASPNYAVQAGFWPALDVAPTATPMTVARTAGVPRLLVAWADVTTHWRAADGGVATLKGMSLTTAGGVTCQTNSTWILYHNNNNVADQITYTITDAQGEVTTGAIQITINPFVTGQTTGSLTVSNGKVNVSFHAIPDLSYKVQRSLDLAAWKTIGPVVARSNDGVVSLTDDFADLTSAPASAYYRLMWEP